MLTAVLVGNKCSWVGWEFCTRETRKRGGIRTRVNYHSSVKRLFSSKKLHFQVLVRERSYLWVQIENKRPTKSPLKQNKKCRCWRKQDWVRQRSNAWNDSVLWRTEGTVVLQDKRDEEVTTKVTPVGFWKWLGFVLSNRRGSGRETPGTKNPSYSEENHGIRTTKPQRRYGGHGRGVRGTPQKFHENVYLGERCFSVISENHFFVPGTSVWRTSTVQNHHLWNFLM